MADTKLTRDWVQKELEYHTNIVSHCGIRADNNERYAALCRHYLATEQDARDAARYRHWRKRQVEAQNSITDRDEERITEAQWDAELDAALTQKEPPK